MWRRKLQRVLKQTIVDRLHFSTAPSKSKEVDVNNIRNIGILAHIDAGKKVYGKKLIRCHYCDEFCSKNHCNNSMLKWGLLTICVFLIIKLLFIVEVMYGVVQFITQKCLFSNVFSCYSIQQIYVREHKFLCSFFKVNSFLMATVFS